MASSAPDSSSGALVDITVKTLDGQNRSFTVPENLTVRQFKEKISGSIEITADTQRLIYQGRVMQDEKPLQDYDIHGKAIHVVQRAPPSNLTEAGSSNTGTERTARPPRPGGDTNLLDVQIHVGRVQQGSNGHGARCRFRQAQFNLGLINDAFDLLEERTNISVNDCPPPDYTESVQGEDMDTSSSQADSVGPTQASDTSNSQANGADTSSQANSQAQPEGSQPSGTDSPPSGLTATELADFLDRVLSTNSRMTPHLRLYRNYLRNEQNYPSESQEVTNAQEVMDRVSEALHAMSHLMHNLSDVIVDMSTDVPRTITAGPPPPALPVPGATSMAIPIHMNVRARHGGNGGARPRARHQAGRSAAAASSGQTATGESDGNTPTTDTPSSTIPPQGNSQTTGGEAPPVTANFNAGPVPGIMQATVDITQGFRLPPGAIPLNLGHLGDPTNIMMVVSDIQTAADGQQHGVATSGTTTAPGAPSTATTTGATSTTTSSSSNSASTSITFGPTTSINLGPGMNMGSLPNVPGLPAGMLQNILGSVLATHGVQPGQPVRVNMVQQPRPPGPEHRQGVNDLPLDGDTASQTEGLSQARVDASHQTPVTMDASAGTRSNAATNTSQSNVAPAVNAATNTSSSGPSNSTTTSTQHVRASVGTHTDPAFNTSSQATNTPQRPSVHIHRGSMGIPGGVRLPGPVLGIPTNGGGRGHVDPFLPCHSSHYNSESVRRVQRSSQAQQNMVPNLSTMVSGLVGDIIEQVGQAINTGNANRVATSGSTPSSSTSTSSATGRTTATSSTSNAPTTTSTGQHSAGTATLNQSLPLNPMDMLAGLMGQRGPGGAPGAPMALDLGSLLSGMMNPMMQGSGPGPNAGPATGSAGTLAELFNQVRVVSSGSDEEGEETEGVLVSLLESMSPYIYLTDLLSLTMGNTQVLGRLRVPLHTFVEERLAQYGSIEELVQTSLNDVQPNIRYIESLVDVREGVDMARSLRECLQTHLRIIFTYVHRNAAGNDAEYGRQLHGLWMTMMADVIALCIYCIKDGHQGFCNMLTAYMPRLTQGMDQSVTGWMTSSLQDILSSFHRNHPVPESAIMKYVVKTQASETKVGDGAKGSTSSSVPPVPNTPKQGSRDMPSEARSVVGTQAVPMDITQSPSPQPPKAKVARTGEKTADREVFVDASETLTSNTTTARTNKPNTLSTSVAATASSRTSARESSQLTNGQNGDTSWQTVIPQEWIPVINQDTVRQQSQRSQHPVSDAYLQGLPAKRRRMMGLEHAGEMGNMAQYLPDSLSRAARAAGAEPISSEENLLQEASDNLTLQGDLEREVVSVLESRVANDQDHSSDRFPNSHLYFHKSRRH